MEQILKTPDRLRDFPISFLAIALGLIGLSLAHQKLEPLLPQELRFSPLTFLFSSLISLIIILIYSTKLILHTKEALSEYNHPIKRNFFPILAKLFLISSIILLPSDRSLSFYLWVVGVILQSLFSLSILSGWINKQGFKTEHLNPSWFIPVVGSIIVPIAGVSHADAQINWFFFSLGLMWWALLFVVIINRMIFHNPIPQRLMPTLFILFAPPAIGFISYIRLTGTLDPIAMVLYHMSLSLFLLILFQAPILSRLKFYLSWWAYSFPLVAIVVATLLMYHESGCAFFKDMAIALFSLLTLAILMLIYKTSRAIQKKRLCVPDEE